MRGTGGRGGRDDPVALARAAYRVEAPFGGTRQTQEEQVRGGVGVGWVKFEVRDRSTEQEAAKSSPSKERSRGLAESCSAEGREKPGCSGLHLGRGGGSW